MPRYKVTLREEVIYHIEVEAANEAEAEAAAEEAFVQAEETGAFFSHVDDRSAIESELIEE